MITDILQHLNTCGYSRVGKNKIKSVTKICHPLVLTEKLNLKKKRPWKFFKLSWYVFVCTKTLCINKKKYSTLDSNIAYGSAELCLARSVGFKISSLYKHSSKNIHILNVSRLSQYCAIIQTGNMKY